jgi:transketolase
MHTIKPIDEELVIKYAEKTGAVLTCENHQTATGMGAAVASVLAEKCPTPVYNHGVKGEFGEVGDLAYLKERYGFNSGKIVELAEKLVKGKSA